MNCQFIYYSLMTINNIIIRTVYAVSAVHSTVVDEYEY